MSAAALERIPLPLRIVGYYLVSIAFLFAALPWCASRLDALIPAWRPALPPLIVWLGWLIAVFAFVGYTAASLHLMTRGRGPYIEFDPPREFVTTGPFRWCRNPIAACVVLMQLGLGLAFASPGILLLFLVALPLAHAQVTLLEEPLLLKRFGERYANYLKRVPRWIPRQPREPSP